MRRHACAARRSFLIATSIVCSCRFYQLPRPPLPAQRHYLNSFSRCSSASSLASFLLLLLLFFSLFSTITNPLFRHILSVFYRLLLRFVTRTMTHVRTSLGFLSTPTHWLIASFFFIHRHPSPSLSHCSGLLYRDFCELLLLLPPRVAAEPTAAREPSLLDNIRLLPFSSIPPSFRYCSGIFYDQLPPAVFIVAGARHLPLFTLFTLHSSSSSSSSSFILRSGC